MSPLSIPEKLFARLICHLHIRCNVQAIFTAWFVTAGMDGFTQSQWLVQRLARVKSQTNKEF